MHSPSWWEDTRNLSIQVPGLGFSTRRRGPEVSETWLLPCERGKYVHYTKLYWYILKGEDGLPEGGVTLQVSFEGWPRVCKGERSLPKQKE